MIKKILLLLSFYQFYNTFCQNLQSTSFDVSREQQECNSPFQSQLDEQKISYYCDDNLIIVQNLETIEVNLVLNQFKAQLPSLYFIQISNLTLSLDLKQLQLFNNSSSTQQFILIDNCKNVKITQFNVEQYLRVGSGLKLASFINIEQLNIDKMNLTDSSTSISNKDKGGQDIMFYQIQNLSQQNFIVNSFNADILITAVTYSLQNLFINSYLNYSHTFALGINVQTGLIPSVILNDDYLNNQQNIQIVRLLRFYPQQILTINQILIQSLNYLVQQQTRIEILSISEYQYFGNFTMNEITYGGIKQGDIPSDTVNLYVLSTLVSHVNIMQTNFQLIPFNSFQMIFIQGAMIKIYNMALRNCLKNNRLIEFSQVTQVVITSFSIDYNSLRALENSFFYFDSVYTLYLLNLQIPIDPSQDDEQFYSRSGPPLILYYPSSLISFTFYYQFNLINSQINLRNLNIQFVDFENIQLYSFLMESTVISNIYSPQNQNGGCLRFYSPTTLIYLNDTIIEDCGTKQLGGGIYGGYIYKAQNVTVRNCQSDIAGGGVVLSKIQDINIIGNIIFLNNTATYSNNNYLLGFSNIEIDSVFEYNQNFQGTDLYMKQIYLDQQQNGYIFYSGLVYVITIKIDALYPQAGRFIIPTNQISLFQVNYTQFQSQLIPKIQKPYMVFYQNPNNLTPIQSFQLTLVDNYEVKAQFIPLKQQCGQGMEQLLIQNTQIMCKYCDFNSAKYSKVSLPKSTQYLEQVISDQRKFDIFLQENQQDQCQQCDTNLFNQCYSNYSNLNNGYWRNSFTVDQNYIYKCKISPKNCIGGSQVGNYLCKQGSIGIECMDCDVRGDFWGERYGSYGIFQCKKCGNKIKNNILISISIIILFIIVLVLVQSNFKSLKNIHYAKYLSKLNIIYFGSSLNRKSQTSVLIKQISFNFMIFQISNLVSEKSIINFIGFFQTNPLQTQLVSIDCFLSDLLPSDFSIGYSKLILYILFPITSLVGLILIITAYTFLKKRNFKLLQNIGIMTYIYLFIFCFYSYLLEYSVQSLICCNLNSSQSYSMIDLSLSCESSDQLSKIRITGVIILVVVCIISPCYLFIQLFLKRKQLYKIQVLLRYGFVYREYKQQFYIWELIRLILKTSLVVVKVSFLDQLNTLSNIFSIFLVFYLILFLVCKPYTYSQFNKAEIASMIISIIGNFGSSLYRQQEDQSSDSDAFKFYNFLLYLTQSIQVILLMYLSILAVLSFFSKSLTKLSQQRHFHWLEKYFPKYSKRLQDNFAKLRKLVKNIKQNKNIYQNSIDQENLLSQFELNTLNQLNSENSQQNN